MHVPPKASTLEATSESHSGTVALKTLRIYLVSVKNNLGPSSSSGLSNDPWL